ncbi:MAG: leucyl/phenylalanyl-tRNA--protein transferase [Rhodanobacter sp.]|nr:MAG: leucyl/phenylalanyl-tRNA--protein transferase [Rhodanobacter sp.]TAM10043.1 MAG: leucyl/phenylalanyl-tRNA--protein transferase [Rhodanobacter sp.]TAM34739.1 MAG: leucyl/phenylalanyl-tRNA--protein transferase [Rhodanobacter sp.]
MIHLPQLDAHVARFPDPDTALREPNGLLAIGGDLSPERLLAAYAQGIFPWFGPDEPLLWWSPDPRCVFRTETLRADRSLRRQWRGKHWRLTVDRAFRTVMEACAAPRHGEPGTWIVPEMIDAYCRLHVLGHAHSVEAWDGERLIGGVYGVAIGKLFCGESMFSAVSGGSKTALMGLATLLRALGCPLLDSQVANTHTLRLGAVEIPRATYLHEAARLAALPGRVGSWARYASQLAPPDAAHR